MSADTFVREARDGLQTLSDGLVELEQIGDRETIDDLFRTAHSLKSGFAMEGHDRASELAHAIEDVLDAMRAGRLTPNESAVDELFDAADVLNTLLNEIERNGRTRTDPTHTVKKLQQVVEKASAADSPSPEPSATSGADSADEAAIDGTVKEALDAASEFDDLEALVAQMDDPEAVGTLEGGGSFDDLFDDQPATEERSAGSSDGADSDTATAAGEAPTETYQDSPADTDDRFLAAKSRVDEDTSIEELQAEIAAESFGEFDDEDTLTIQELVSMEPASGTDSSAEDETDDGGGTDETIAPEAIVDTAEADVESDTETADTPASADFGRVTGETGTGEPTVENAEPSDAIADSVDLDAVSTAEGDDSVAAFGADAGMADFESRFESLFASDEDAGRGPAAATIEESALQTSRYRHTEAPTATERTDGVQSLTVDVEYADDLLSLVEDLSVSTQRLADQTENPAAAETAESVAGSVRDLQRTVMEIRLMPVETVTGRLDRVVRDSARETDKDIDLQIEGAGTRVDRSIIDCLGDPLVHLVRNAVDHGIEPPAERETAGKPPTGTVEVSVRRSGDEVVIEVADDGRGIDPDAARTAAVDAGVMSRAEAAALSDSEACDLIWRPGLSTADSVTKTSGRGVGMDVVKREVDALNGDLSVESEPGTGTTVRLRLPVTMAVSEVLLVAADGREFALPATDVERIGPAGEARFADTLSTADTDRTTDLAAAMDGDPVGDDPSLVTVDTDDGPLTVKCDRVIGRREVVISPYDDLLASIPGVSGATTGTRGQLAHVVDVDEL